MKILSLDSSRLSPLPRLLLLLAASLAACSTVTKKEEPLTEDCAVAGDEDENGTADCEDAACAEADGCRIECGDGLVHTSEECDEGASENGPGKACNARCERNVCGDGDALVGVEECDTGTAENGPGKACSEGCLANVCGDGDRLVGVEQCDDGNEIDGDACEADCSAPYCGNGISDLQEDCDDGNAANADGCSKACTPTEFAYLKASNTDPEDQFGRSMALSADGSTLAVGAFTEDSAATGVGGDHRDNSAEESGAVYVFVRNGATWRQQAYIKASNTGRLDVFGVSVALSADGSTLAVGATGEASDATGIGGDQANDRAAVAGAVYVFARTGTRWQQQAYVKASNTDLFDGFGVSVSLSDDGATLAVGAGGESSSAAGVDGDQADNAAVGAGAVYVFRRIGVTWIQESYIKASNPDEDDLFGVALQLSGDGATLAVGATGESSDVRGINGDQSDNSARSAGAVYVFARTGPTWRQQAYVKASNTGENDNFGQSVDLSTDGSTLAVSALAEDSGATGVDGDEEDDSTPQAGAAYVFKRSGTAWTQAAYVKASNTEPADLFGQCVALSPDGLILAVSAQDESSASTGLDGDQRNNAAAASGAVYTFRVAEGAWAPQNYVKATNADNGDAFGASIALAVDGTLVVTATGESSSAIGVNGDQADETAPAAGAVYVIE